MTRLVACIVVSDRNRNLNGSALCLSLSWLHRNRDRDPSGMDGKQSPGKKTDARNNTLGVPTEDSPL